MKRVVIGFLLLMSIAYGAISKENIEKQMKDSLREEFGEDFTVKDIKIITEKGRFVSIASISLAKEDESAKQYKVLQVMDKEGDVLESFNNFPGEETEDRSKILSGQMAEVTKNPVIAVVPVKTVEQRFENGIWVEEKSNGPVDYALISAMEKPEEKRVIGEYNIYLTGDLSNSDELAKRKNELFEFVKYMKEEKFLDYTKLNVYYIDPVTLSPYFQRSGEGFDNIMKTELLKRTKQQVEFAKKMIVKSEEQVKNMNEEKKQRMLDQIYFVKNGPNPKVIINGTSIIVGPESAKVGIIKKSINYYENVNDISIISNDSILSRI